MENDTPKTVPGLLWKVITDFDKPFRIMAPGFIILILIFWKGDIKPTILFISKINILYLLITITLLGICYYSIHRTVFSVFDFLMPPNLWEIIFKSRPKKNNKNKSKTNEKNKNNAFIKSFSTELPDTLKREFHIFNASFHSAAMCCELIIIFCLIKKLPKSFLLIFGLSIFVVIIIFFKIREMDIQYNVKVSSELPTERKKENEKK